MSEHFFRTNCILASLDTSWATGRRRKGDREVTRTPVDARAAGQHGAAGGSDTIIIRGHSQMTSADREGEGVIQILMQIGRLRDSSTEI